MCLHAFTFILRATPPGRRRNDVCCSNGRRLALDVCEVGVAATQPPFSYGVRVEHVVINNLLGEGSKPDRERAAYAALSLRCAHLLLAYARCRCMLRAINSDASRCFSQCLRPRRSLTSLDYRCGERGNRQRSEPVANVVHYLCALFRR